MMNSRRAWNPCPSMKRAQSNPPLRGGLLRCRSVTVVTVAFLCLLQHATGRERRSGEFDVLSYQTTVGDDLTDALREIAAQPATDMLVKLPPGSFFLSNEVVFKDKNLHISGAGSGLTRILAKNPAAKITYLDTSKSQESN